MIDTERNIYADSQMQNCAELHAHLCEERKCHRSPISNSKLSVIAENMNGNFNLIKFQWKLMIFPGNATKWKWIERAAERERGAEWHRERGGREKGEREHSIRHPYDVISKKS